MIEKKRKTFLSYSRSDKDFALKLAKELKDEGFDIWLDQLDIPTGSRWDDEVEQALNISDIFMVILTPASITSDNVKDEIGYAIDARKRILPVLLENATLPLRLRRFQYVDFTSKSYEEGIETAKKLLKSLIDQGLSLDPPKDLQIAAQVGPYIEQPFPTISAKTESEPKQTDKNKSGSRAMSYGFGLVIVLVMMGIVFRFFLNSELPTPTPVSASIDIATIPTSNGSGSEVSVPTDSQSSIQCGNNLISGTVTGINVSRVEYEGNASLQAFVQGQSGNWFEVTIDNNTYTEIPYQEVNRDEWSVYLHDSERNYDIQLDLYKGEVLEDFNTGHGRVKRNNVIKSYTAETGYAVCVVQYNGGEFVQTDNLSWIENTSDDTVFRYVELDRDQWSVYLYDRSRDRKIRIDLYNKQIYLDENNGNGEFVVYEILSAENQTQQK